ncbi:MAG: VOC family protein [Heyndrickxia sp.]
MIYEMTIQVRVTDMEKALKWYSTLLNKDPDFIPHEGFAEWELIPGCWLQVAEGIPAEESGPIRFGVTNMENLRDKLIMELGIEEFEIYQREEVPVKWGTFCDPWGNRIGLFEYIDKEKMDVRVKEILER